MSFTDFDAEDRAFAVDFLMALSAAAQKHKSVSVNRQVAMGAKALGHFIAKAYKPDQQEKAVLFVSDNVKLGIQEGKKS